jgi:Arm DNA-binding domain
MALTVNQLTATKVQKVKAPGMYPDGAGLYLQVTGEAAKSWVLRYSLRAKAREMGLGSLRKVSLADARRKAAECHKLLDNHIDPIEHRTQARAAAALANAKSITFKEASTRYIAMRSKGLKNAKHAAQWGTTIATYAEPILGRARRRGSSLPMPPAENAHVVWARRHWEAPGVANVKTQKRKTIQFIRGESI